MLRNDTGQSINPDYRELQKCGSEWDLVVSLSRGKHDDSGTEGRLLREERQVDQLERGHFV